MINKFILKSEFTSAQRTICQEEHSGIQLKLQLNSEKISVAIG